ncbi:MAG: DUF305 domain-containing protein [Ilumatobacteraceae bacterium]
MDTQAHPDLSLDQLVELERRRADAEEQAARAGSAPDDDLVLPWWQHPMNIVTIVVTTAILAAMVGWLIGDSSSEPEHNSVDTGFLQDMRLHHEQAVLMSLVYRNLDDTDPSLRTAARTILIGQSQEVGRMSQLLDVFGESTVNETGTAMAWMGMPIDAAAMPGMATDDELDRLGRLSETEADDLFVQLMTSHHQAGIAMADFAAINAANDKVRTFAAALSHAQQSDIVEMEQIIRP